GESNSSPVPVVAGPVHRSGCVVAGQRDVDLPLQEPHPAAIPADHILEAARQRQRTIVFSSRSDMYPGLTSKSSMQPRAAPVVSLPGLLASSHGWPVVLRSWRSVSG